MNASINGLKSLVSRLHRSLTFSRKKNRVPRRRQKVDAISEGHYYRKQLGSKSSIIACPIAHDFMSVSDDRPISPATARLRLW